VVDHVDLAAVAADDTDGSGAGAGAGEDGDEDGGIVDAGQ